MAHTFENSKLFIEIFGDAYSNAFYSVFVKNWLGRFIFKNFQGEFGDASQKIPLIQLIYYIFLIKIGAVGRF